MSIKIVTAIQARKILGTIMNAVSFGNDQYIVERIGTPMVAIIPVKKLQQMEKARMRFFKNMSKISESFNGEDGATLENMLEEATIAAKNAERTQE